MEFLVAAVSCAVLSSPDLWDMKLLEQPPRVWPAEEAAASWLAEIDPDAPPEHLFTGEGVRPLFYEGLPWQDKPTRVFAWYGVPERAGDEKVPAIVLAHGGGGTAFDEWVRLWTSRGYAAISMDLTGSRPGGVPGERPRHPWGGPDHGDDIARAALPPREQWVYNAVADIILANSLLRSFPEVDADRIGLVGISWGGFLSGIVPGVDHRFAFSVPIYACGYLSETPQIGASWANHDQALARKWMALWDPSNYVADFTCPTLWLNGANDPHFPLDLHSRTVAHCGGDARLSVHPGLAHSHVHGWLPEEPYAFADEVLRGQQPLVHILDHGLDGQTAWVRVEEPARVANALLVHTSDTGPWEQCSWQETPIALEGSTDHIQFDIPEGCRRFFVNLRDPRGLTTSTQVTELPDNHFFTLRNGIENSRHVFEQTGHGRVAFLGGSITAMPGWRDHTCAMLQERFTNTEFDFINAGLGGTDSTLGAFRFQDDVFGKGRVDLLFLEFAVNDSAGLHAKRGMEGIIRQARRLNPAIDIVVQYFIDTGKLNGYRAGRTPQVILDHDGVVQHYALPAINLAEEMTRRLGVGEFVWDEFSRDNCHPLPFGHECYAACIAQFLDAAWNGETSEAAVERPLPAPLEPNCYEHARFVETTEAHVVNGWRMVNGWEAAKTCNYGGAVDVLTGDAPDDTLYLDFEGTAAGFYGIAGMDAGTLIYSVDDGEEKAVDLFDSWCHMFHRPVCYLLAEDLEPGKHRLHIRISNDRNEKSEGTACRVLKFVAN